MSTKSIGKLLLESLTEDQVADLLDIVFSTQDISSFIEAFRKVDPDLAQTIHKMLHSVKKKSGEAVPAQTVSDKRLMELWANLWKEWDNIVAQLGDEEGCYMIQEQHWEPPYFDGYSLASDLDNIAEKMLELIDDVFGLADDEDLFRNALEEIGANIDAYPDYLNVSDYDGCDLGPNVTHCLLQWAWRSTQTLEHPGRAVLQQVRELDKIHAMMSLDSQACLDFFISLPDEICREIYSSLIGDPEGYDIHQVHSKWHQLFHWLEQQYDVAAYLKTCREHLADNWQYGKPLIDEALGKHEYRVADQLLEQTFASYLRMKDEKTWRPETTLLIDASNSYHPCLEEVGELLDVWRQVSEKLGDPLRQAACEFQTIVLRTPNDWDAVIGCYRSRKDAERQILTPLFNAWKEKAATSGTHYHYYTRTSEPVETWTHWLIEAMLDIEGKQQWFIEKLRGWLAELNSDPKKFQAQWKWLALFTKDVPGAEKAAKDYPALFSVAMPSDDESDEAEQSRRKALKKASAGECRQPAIEVWKKQLSTIVPDPAQSSGSQYTSCAHWMKALLQLNRQDYEALLNTWRENHKRRRNLWRDMQAEKLPL